MALIFLLGRVLFAGFVLKNAYNHLGNTAALAGYAKSKGVASPRFAVIGSGLLLLAGGLGVLLGVYVQYALACLVLFLLPVSFTMHAYWRETDAMGRMSDEVNFWKNMGLLGAVLMMYAIATPWAYSL